MKLLYDNGVILSKDKKVFEKEKQVYRNCKAGKFKKLPNATEHLKKCKNCCGCPRPIGIVISFKW